MAPSPHRGLPIRTEYLTFRSKRVGATVSGIWEESTGNSRMESGQNHPIAMYMLSITALFQNFCFWGVVSFYPLYLTGQLQYSEADATQSYGVFLDRDSTSPLGRLCFFLHKTILGLYPISVSMPGVGMHNVVLEHRILAPF